MSTTTLTRANTTNSHNSGLVSLVKKAKHWNTVRKAKNDLYKMDDRMLADIGLTRGDINRRVRGL